MEKLFTVVMIGPRGERDYVEKMLEGGLPCICGDAPKYAGVFNEVCANNIAKQILSKWMATHVEVRIEPVVTPC